MRLFFSLLVVALFLEAPSGLQAQDLIISEFMADNARTLADEDGDFSDWIEVHNSSGLTADLAGYSLTDDPALLTKWSFPSVQLGPGGYLVVFASGKNRIDPVAPLHTNFQMDQQGEFLALVQPDGVTLATVFSPEYPPQREDVAYGIAQKSVTTSLLANSAPRILVPGSAAALAADWASVAYSPGAEWLNGSAPAAIGFDVSAPGVVPTEVARGGAAVQSTTGGINAAARGIDGSQSTHTQTLGTDNAPFWQVTLANEASIYRIVLHNRSACCQSRLRDITVQILASDGTTTNYASPLLNPENLGFTYPGGPAELVVDLEGQGPVLGRIVRVLREPDLDLSGSSGQGDADEAAVLSLGEVEVFAVSVAAEVNLARTGSPAPTATQSTTSGGFTPNLAVDGNLGNFTHTAGTDAAPSWTLNLGRRAIITSVVLHNRDSCCGSRLRDITVELLDVDGSSVLYASPLLNPENTGFSFPNGPDNLVVDLTAGPVLGQYVRVRRTPDPDLSGTGGQGNEDEAAVLSLGEVIVVGLDANGYRPFIRTDLEQTMFGKNASAFVRLTFNVTDPSEFTALTLRTRYDDGFIAVLNGQEVATRNAPAVALWNSSATADRGVTAGIQAESVNLTAALGHVVAGANLLAIHAMNSSAADGDFLFQPELEVTRVEVSANAYLVEATPGTANDTEFYFGDVADTAFSVNRGFFDQPFALEITSATVGAAIYYSFDGSEPGPTQGMLYSGPVAITNTSIVRARAFKEGLKSTDVDTQTYLFLEDVLHQAPTGQAPPFFPASWGANAVNYGMDPNVVSQYSAEEWDESLTQIPSISIVTEMPNLFDPATGIYANALQHGIDWERPASIELLDSSASPADRFQENCGLRIRGGFSRNTQFVKHSFRVFFRRAYGQPKLNYPLFEGEGADQFDTFDLRTSQNYSWPRESSFNTGRHDTLTRDVFCRDTLGAMGQPYTRSRYYHLYLNGQYWGIYMTQERAEASYGETYFGGNKDDYDVVKSGNHVLNFRTEATDGNLVAFSNLWTRARSLPGDPANANYFAILGRNADGTRNPALPVLVDADNLIDYMLEIFYSGDGDAPLSSFLSNNQANNWFGMRSRTNPDMGFRFFNQDSEHTLGSPNSNVDRTGPFGGSNQNNFTYANPQWIHQDLAANAEYRLRFADHVHRHFFNEGALTPQAGTNRFLTRAAMINKAIRAYSARWGDVQREPPYGESEWTNIIAEIVSTWFPPRTALVLNQLRADNLYPSIAAPVFNQHGGEIVEGFALSMEQTNAGGTIFFTMDGTDPRLVGGAVSGTAQVYSEPVILNLNSRVKARVQVGGSWSALNEADFALPSIIPLRITEIMYHPRALTAAELAAGFMDSEDFEYLELRNVGPFPIPLIGTRFVNGITFTFGSGILGAGERVLLVKNVDAFAFRYGGNPNIAGSYSGNLNNGGERLRLEDFFGRVIADFSYSDNWYPITDGFGFSLVIDNDSAPPSTYATKSSWRQSSGLGGSPGSSNPPPPIFPPVFINELRARPTAPNPVAVELHNRSDQPADISHWWLTDMFRSPKKFQLPASTILPPGGFLVLVDTDFDGAALGTNALNFSSTGGEIRLFSAGSEGELTGYYQGWDFGPSDRDVSFGRHVISTGADHFVAQAQNTIGMTNAGPRISPVVISEIMYRPPDVGIQDNSQDEFIELFNATSGSVDLFDSAGNTWRITGGVDYLLPANVALGPGQHLVLVSFDPLVDTVQAAAFTARYGLAPGTVLIGPYAGKLDNSGESVELRRPTLLSTGLPSFVLMDKVSYEDSDPWPGGADGYGLSLQRNQATAYGNDPAHWIAVLPTTGAALVLAGQAPQLTTQPSRLVIRPSGTDFSLSVTATGTGPLGYQWRRGGFNLPGANDSTLTVSSAQPSESGLYRVAVYNQAGSVVSEPAVVIVLAPPRIVAHPTSVMVDPDANVSFTVSAESGGSLTYQWRFNGVDIFGATNRTLQLPSVQFHVHNGDYSVAVTDEGGTAVSRAASLVILVSPAFVVQPSAQDVPVGGTAVFSVMTSGTLPMGYRWRRGGSTLLNEVVTRNYSFLVLTNVQTTDAGPYSVVITNAAFYTPGFVSTPARLTVLIDTDQDGLPDDWEMAHEGFDPADPTDAGMDADGDGMTNVEEYQAGTDYLDPLSYLRVDIRLGGAAIIEFVAAADKTYTLLYKDGLTQPAWSGLAHFPAQVDSRIETFVDGQANGGVRFYRMVTPAQTGASQ